MSKFNRLTPSGLRAWFGTLAFFGLLSFGMAVFSAFLISFSYAKKGLPFSYWKHISYFQYAYLLTTIAYAVITIRFYDFISKRSKLIFGVLYFQIGLLTLGTSITITNTVLYFPNAHISWAAVVGLFVRWFLTFLLYVNTKRLAGEHSQPGGTMPENASVVTHADESLQNINESKFDVMESNTEVQKTHSMFQVVFTGIRPNIPPSEATTRLAALFKAQPEQVQTLLTLPQYVLKKGLSADIAVKYQAAIKEAGGVCHIEPEKSTMQ